MRANGLHAVILEVCFGAGLALFVPGLVCAQSSPPDAASTPAAKSADDDVRALAGAIHDLQAEVAELRTQMNELRADEQRARDEAQALQRELAAARVQSASLTGSVYATITPTSSAQPTAALGSANTSTPTSAGTPASSYDSSASQVVAQSQGDQSDETHSLIEGKLRDLYQTKVESGSKYRLRLTGIVLVNLFANRGAVDNQDFPTLAADPASLGSGGTFGGSMRQSQIGVQAFGPDIAGAHTSANVAFDFAGGIPDTPYGTSSGLVRLRTGDVRFDWGNTSIIAGQDTLFISPLQPTSLASLAIPALAYAGNLWSWTPQVRVEHAIHLSDTSTLLFQGGILDSLSGELPATYYARMATAGEKSGQPAYAARTSWSTRAFGRPLTIGIGGYFARQDWSYRRNVNAWAGTADVSIPLGKYFDFSSEFYRGRAVGGIGGGVGQSITVSGYLSDPAAYVQGLDSVGGWAQLKFKPLPKFEINAAFGEDNPFASELYQAGGNAGPYSEPLGRNQSWFVNYIYRPRSDVLISTEFRRWNTRQINDYPYLANQASMSIGYIF
jgi:FtsZ-binding cell division protein ZapB